LPGAAVPAATMVALESESDLERGDAAPPFELAGVDGETYTPESFADYEALLVTFTCNHCPYAQAKFELMNRLAAERDDCAVVGINPNDEAAYPEDSFEEMVGYVERGEIDFDAYLRDDTQAVAEAYGAVCTPDPFLFAREGGEWVLAYHGRFDDALNPDEEPTAVYVDDAIDAAVDGVEVSIPDRPSRGCSIKWKED